MASVSLNPAGLDAPALSALKRQAASDPQAAVRAAARQFEALFMQEIMKSMRAATLSSGLMDNDSTKLGTEMLDTQYASRAAGRPGGLADLIARQLQRQIGVGTAPAAPDAAVAPHIDARAPGIPDRTAADFIEQHGAAARAAEASSGIPAAFMLAQAGHESGWGSKPVRSADGRDAHNLFGIKATAGWKGPVAEVLTTEVVAGQAMKMVQRFRAYASAAESFADYAQMMRASPRYQGVREAGANAQRFAQGLQDAGYATDPAYAAKLARAIHTTLRVQRAAA